MNHSKQFAKLYGDPENQILVLFQMDDDEGLPEIRTFVVPDGLGVCSVALKYKDTDGGWDDAETDFKNIDEKQARSLANKVHAAVSDFATDPGSETGDNND